MARSAVLRHEANQLGKIEAALDALPDDAARRRAITWVLDTYAEAVGHVASTQPGNGTSPQPASQHGLEGLRGQHGLEGLSG